MDRARVRWEGCEETRSREAQGQRIRLRAAAADPRATALGKTGCSFLPPHLPRGVLRITGIARCSGSTLGSGR